MIDRDAMRGWQRRFSVPSLSSRWKARCLQGVITSLKSSEGARSTMAMLRSSRFVAYAETAGPRRASASSQTAQNSLEEQPAEQPATEGIILAASPSVEWADAEDAARNPMQAQFSPSVDAARAEGASAAERASPAELSIEGAGRSTSADDLEPSEGSLRSEGRSASASRAGSAALSDDDERQSPLPAIVRCKSPPPASERRVSTTEQRTVAAAPARPPVTLSDTAQMGSSLGQVATTRSATGRPVSASAEEDVPSSADSPERSPTPRSSVEAGVPSVPSQDGACGWLAGSAGTASPAAELQPLNDSASATSTDPASHCNPAIGAASALASASSGSADAAAVCSEDDTVIGVPTDITAAEVYDAESGSRAASSSGGSRAGSSPSELHGHDRLDAGDRFGLSHVCAKRLSTQLQQEQVMAAPWTRNRTSRPRTACAEQCCRAAQGSARMTVLSPAPSRSLGRCLRLRQLSSCTGVLRRVSRRPCLS